MKKKRPRRPLFFETNKQVHLEGPCLWSLRTDKTYTLHTQPLRALDKTHSNCLFSKDVVDLAFEAFVDDRVLKEEGENSAKAKAWSAGEKLVAEGRLR